MTSLLLNRPSPEEDTVPSPFLIDKLSTLTILQKSELIDEAREVYRRGIELASRSGDQRSRNEMQDSLAMLE